MGLIRPAWAQQGLLARLQAAKSVTVGITNFPPYSSVGMDGTPGGFVPTVTKVIMGRLGITEIKVMTSTFGELIPAMMAGRCDFISTAMTISKARCAQVGYADPMIADGPCLVSLPGKLQNAPKTIADLVKQKLVVGVSTGGALSRYAASAGVEPGNIRQLPDNNALIDGLVAGQVQIVLQDHAGIEHVYMQRKLPVEVTFPIPDAPKHSSSAAFRKTDSDLRDAYQREFRKMKASGEFQAISRQFGFEPAQDMVDSTAEQACSVAEH
ncbi:transporter substrate-binding domain-containing protein [Pigmentiphaga soli]